MERFDIWDQAVLTNLINRPVETALERAPQLGAQIAAKKTLHAQMARVEVANTYAFGIGQFKAPNAMPALVEMPVGEREAKMIELAQLEEMHRINSAQWMRLNSDDDNIRNSEGLQVVERGQILQKRNERLTEWMRWKAFVDGALTITYPRTNSQLMIDYGFLSGHRPEPADLWTDLEESDPVNDLDNWQTLVAEDSGYVGTKIHLTSKTAKLILRNQNLAAYFNVPSGQPFKPTLKDVAGLLADKTEFVLYDAGFRAMQSAAPYLHNDSAHTRFLPHNRVVITTPYEIEGEQIADTLDGQVEVATSYKDTDILDGPQSEVILDGMTKNRYFRQASSRIVRIQHPECFLSAKVGA
jgi:hypothetical protein